MSGVSQGCDFFLQDARDRLPLLRRKVILPAADVGLVQSNFEESGVAGKAAKAADLVQKISGRIDQRDQADFPVAAGRQ